MALKNLAKYPPRDCPNFISDAEQKQSQDNTQISDQGCFVIPIMKAKVIHLLCLRSYLAYLLLMA
jgi:hypothetical protein